MTQLCRDKVTAVINVIQMNQRADKTGLIKPLISTKQKARQQA